MKEATGHSSGTERLIEELAGKIGGARRASLERLAEAELRYLASRPDLQERYADPHRGERLLEWEMSAVERGEKALGEIDAAVSVDWKNARVLDVGCGDGGFLVAMARRGAVTHGVDLCEGNVIGARLRARAWEVTVRAALGNAIALPYAERSFDVVTCGDVLEHVAEPDGALGEIERVLRPGGILWLAAPTRYLPANVRRDPHYGYFGVSILGHHAAAWYLWRVRRTLPTRHHYEVERLPTYSSTVCALHRLGFEILVGEYRPLAALRDPARIQTVWKRRLAGGLLKFGLRGPLQLSLRLGAELTWPLQLVCRKSADTG